MNRILKYYLIQQLINQGHHQLTAGIDTKASHENLQLFYDNVCNRNVDVEEEGYEIIEEMKTYFDDLNLPNDLLSEVKQLNIIGGDFDVYINFIHPHWQYGDDEATTITSLEGIEKCTNLERLQLECIAHPLNFIPLTACKHLTHLTLSINNKSDLSGLEKNVCLKKLTLNGFVDEEKSETWPGNKVLLEKLELNGVIVERKFHFKERRFF